MKYLRIVTYSVLFVALYFATHPRVTLLPVWLYPAPFRGGDPIDRLIATFETGDVLWKNGAYLPIDLPKDAKPEAVLRGALRGVSFAVLEERKVEIREVGGSAVEYIAARVRIESREEIALMRYEGDKFGGWWIRVF